MFCVEPSVVLTDASPGTSRSGVRIASPIAAERQVDNNVLRSEKLVNVAAVVHKRRIRSAPSARVDHALAVLDLCRDRARLLFTRPEPHLDAARGALHGKPASTVLVERGSERVGFDSLGAAACVVVGVPVAVGLSGGSVWR